jgi:hypothetical protein
VEHFLHIRKRCVEARIHTTTGIDTDLGGALRQKAVDNRACPGDRHKGVVENQDIVSGRWRRR